MPFHNKVGNYSNKFNGLLSGGSDGLPPEARWHRAIRYGTWAKGTGM